MSMKKLNTTSILGMMFLLILFISSCKKDEVIDGGVSSPFVNETTYDFLKNHPSHQFDTTILIIDKLGMKDVINSSGTFFVPNDYMINDLIRQFDKEISANDERKRFTLDSLFKQFSAADLKDAMGMYFVPKKVVREDLTAEGTSYESIVKNEFLLVTLEEINKYTSSTINSKPKVIFVTKVLGERDKLQSDGSYRDPSGDKMLKDPRMSVKTSGIITTTGIVHVLSREALWSFYVAPN